LAFECLVNAPISDQAKLAQVSILAVAAGRSGMVGGQVLDMQFTGRGTELDLDSLMATHRAKTGALIEAAMRLPLPITNKMAGQSKPEINEILVCIGKRVGLLFQMVDDVLDITVSASKLGKTQGKDAAQNKLTYPAVIGLAKTQTEIHAQWQAVLTDLMQLIDMGCDAQSVNLMACLMSETLGLKTDRSL
jgi:geranylgeranyl pyrophosphate synthase